MGSLQTIQKVFKVAKIVSLVFLILSIVGSVACAIGVIVVSIAYSIDSTSTLFVDFMGNTDLDSFRAIVSQLISDSICCAISAGSAYKLKEYFESELLKGTPFDYDVAKNSLETGKILILLWVAAIIVTCVFAFIGSNKVNSLIHPNFYLGLLLIFLHLIFKHGAETESKIQKQNPTNNDNNSTQEKSDNNDSSSKESNKIFL